VAGHHLALTKLTAGLDIEGECGCRICNAMFRWIHDRKGNCLEVHIEAFDGIQETLRRDATSAESGKIPLRGLRHVPESQFPRVPHTFHFQEGLGNKELDNHQGLLLDQQSSLAVGQLPHHHDDLFVVEAELAQADLHPVPLPRPSYVERLAASIPVAQELGSPCGPEKEVAPFDHRNVVSFDHANTEAGHVGKKVFLQQGIQNRHKRFLFGPATC
jgi:hypothetical protein